MSRGRARVHLGGGRLSDKSVLRMSQQSHERPNSWGNLPENKLMSRIVIHLLPLWLCGCGSSARTIAVAPPGNAPVKATELGSDAWAPEPRKDTAALHFLSMPAALGQNETSFGQNRTSLGQNETSYGAPSTLASRLRTVTYFSHLTRGEVV